MPPPRRLPILQAWPRKETLSAHSPWPPPSPPRLPCLYSQKFYGDYYHPNNARFWLYGDDPGGYPAPPLLGAGLPAFTAGQRRLEACFMRWLGLAW